MSGNSSMAGVIGQGTVVEKLQEVQQQSPEWGRQQALAAAEVEKARKVRPFAGGKHGSLLVSIRRAIVSRGRIKARRKEKVRRNQAVGSLMS